MTSRAEIAHSRAIAKMRARPPIDPEKVRAWLLDLFQTVLRTGRPRPHLVWEVCVKPYVVHVDDDPADPRAARIEVVVIGRGRPRTEWQEMGRVAESVAREVFAEVEVVPFPPNDRGVNTGSRDFQRLLVCLSVVGATWVRT